jgi:hypothetical protein
MKICPNDLGGDLTNAINNAARLWFCSPLRPTIQADVLNGWSDLLQNWIADKSIPFFVRSSKSAPGTVIVHPTGRLLVPTDNSPAQWVFTQAEKGIIPSLDDIRHGFENDQIPIAMAIKKKHKADTKYFCNLATLKDNPNNRGWKVAHIESVGLRQRGEIAEMNISDLEAHFIRLLNPSNMFLVPKKWAGFSEIEEVVKLFRANHAIESN